MCFVSWKKANHLPLHNNPFALYGPCKRKRNLVPGPWGIMAVGHAFMSCSCSLRRTEHIPALCSSTSVHNRWPRWKKNSITLLLCALESKLRERARKDWNVKGLNLIPLNDLTFKNFPHAVNVDRACQWEVTYFKIIFKWWRRIAKCL